MRAPSNITIDNGTRAPVHVLVHTVPYSYEGELVTITNEQIVLHTEAGLISIPLSTVPIITHRADESHISQGSRSRAERHTSSETSRATRSPGSKPVDSPAGTRCQNK